MKDLDFMHNDERQQPGQFIASVGGDGSCIVWQLPPPRSQAGVQQLVKLEPPKSERFGFRSGFVGATHVLCLQLRLQAATAAPEAAANAAARAGRVAAAAPALCAQAGAAAGLLC